MKTTIVNNRAEEGASQEALIVRAAGQLCALSLRSVVETMRPMPLRPLPGLPPFVMGASIIRGQLTPVIDASRLLGVEGATSTRLVTLAVESQRTVALAVEAVVGVKVLGAAGAELAPLLKSADAAVIASITTLDADLLLLLQSARLVPASVWEAAGVAAEAQ